MKFRGVEISGYSSVSNDFADSLILDAQRVLGLSPARTGEFLEPIQPDDSTYQWAVHHQSLKKPVVRIWLHEPIDGLGQGEQFVSVNEIEE